MSLKSHYPLEVSPHHLKVDVITCHKKGLLIAMNGYDCAVRLYDLSHLKFKLLIIDAHFLSSKF